MSDDPKLRANRAPNGGKGRPKGAKNKLTQCAKEAFEHAFDAIGGAAALAEWAASNQTEFYKLFARLIPNEQRLGGSDGEAVRIEVGFVSGS